MKISLQAMMVIAAFLAIACFAVAATGFASLGAMTDATQLSDARGYAWFWTFLGAIATAIAATAWWLAHGSKTADASGDAAPKP